LLQTLSQLRFVQIARELVHPLGRFFPAGRLLCLRMDPPFYSA
jgi:hypothetical protein